MDNLSLQGLTSNAAFNTCFFSKVQLKNVGGVNMLTDIFGTAQERVLATCVTRRMHPLKSSPETTDRLEIQSC